MTLTFLNIPSCGMVFNSLNILRIIMTLNAYKFLIVE